jgi:hypothetical protein
MTTEPSSTPIDNGSPVSIPSTTSNERRRQAILRFVMFILVVVGVIYLLTEISQLNQRISKLEQFAIAVSSDITSMNSELASVGALARNANIEPVSN